MKSALKVWWNKYIEVSYFEQSRKPIDARGEGGGGYGRRFESEPQEKQNRSFTVRPVSVKYGRYMYRKPLYTVHRIAVERGWSQLRTLDRRKQNENVSRDRKIRWNIVERFTQSTRISRVKLLRRGIGLNEHAWKTFAFLWSNVCGISSIECSSLSLVICEISGIGFCITF